MKWVRKKIEAASIQYVLVISVIILIVLSAFISLIYLQKRIAQKGALYKETMHHAHQTFNYLAQSEVPYNTTKDFVFSEYANESTGLERTHWGIFDLVSVTAKLRNEEYRKIGIAGGKNTGRSALYLQDTKKPLVLVGNTKINGNVFLPAYGVKPGSIAGVSYYGSSLINGTIKQSSTSFPSLQNIEYIKTFIRDKNVQESEEFELEDGMQRQRSFALSTLVYNSNESIYLQNVQLEGNIMIVSDKKIIVHPSTTLQHVILIAPKIEVLGTTKGSFQALASEQVIIGAKSTLEYPSAIVVSALERTGEDRQVEAIKIGENSIVKGVVVYDTQTREFDYNTQVLIDEGVRVVGEVYCKKNLELKGKVNGTVSTGNFLARASGGVYVNHLYDAVIDGVHITPEFSGLFMSGTHLSVAKWVY